MDLVKPDIGLIFWMTLSFLILLYILKKFAWKPILNSLHEREHTIEDALTKAEQTKKEMAGLVADHERLLTEAKAERDVILKEAREAKDSIIEEAKERAASEEQRLLTIAREAIQNEKMAAVTDLKNEVAAMSIIISEKLLRQKLDNGEDQKKHIEELLKDVDFTKKNYSASTSS